MWNKGKAKKIGIGDDFEKKLFRRGISVESIF
jgi:hypothetical protein